MTITIQIGNTDNKLTQQEWSRFVKRVADHVEYYAEENLAQVHFFAASSGEMAWQNAAWVMQFTDDEIPNLRVTLAEVAKDFSQDSIAMTCGTTEFVKPS